jgi:hypothetical protein
VALVVSDQPNNFTVLANLNALRQGFEEDGVALRHSLDEGKSYSSPISQHQGFIRQRFNNNRVVQTLG